MSIPEVKDTDERLCVASLEWHARVFAEIECRLIVRLNVFREREREREREQYIVLSIFLN